MSSSLSFEKVLTDDVIEVSNDVTTMTRVACVSLCYPVSRACLDNVGLKVLEVKRYRPQFSEPHHNLCLSDH